MGLLNNSAYVVMIAGAKSISEGGTALVFLCNVFPSLLVKLSAPCWFHLIGYKARIYLCAILFAMSFCMVGFYADIDVEEDSNQSSRYIEEMELMGVALSAFGGGLGEASLLALAGRYDINQEGVNLTAFSSGTGLAGVFGFLWVEVFHEWLGWSFTTTLLLANILALLYALTYLFLLAEDTSMNITLRNDEDLGHEMGAPLRDVQSINSEDYEELEMHTLPETITENTQEKKNQIQKIKYNSRTSLNAFVKGYEGLDHSDHTSDNNPNSINDNAQRIPLELLNVDNISGWDRFRLVASLWPYMVPLFFVYFAEYALQSGAWTAIGFPVEDINARNTFYTNANWLYQAGVFVSRSSGTLYQASMTTLWILPFVQIINLIFFVYTSIYHIWYNSGLFILCFGTGLIGGAVYVNAYTRINSDLPSHQKEFSLASASVADSFGIVLADIAGLFIQSCVYKANSIPGADVTCPIR